MEKGREYIGIVWKIFENCGNFELLKVIHFYGGTTNLYCNNCQTPVPSPDFSLGLGVDFVLPLSQEQEQQEQQQEQEQPHQNIPEGNILEVLNLAKSLTKPNQTHATPSLH